MKVEIQSRDLGFDEFFKRAKEIENARVQVGVLGDDNEPGSDLTVGEIAAIQEFGTEDGRIPSRPFLRSTFDAQREHLAKMGGELIDKVMAGKMNVKKALGIMGASLAASVKLTITAGVPPPNAPSTIMKKLGKKGRSIGQKGVRGFGRALAQIGAAASVKPLIDTGRLLNSVTWSIEDE